MNMGMITNNINLNSNITNESTSTFDKKLNDNTELNKIQDESPIKNTDGDYAEKDLKKALKELNKYLEADNTKAEYSVHKDLGTIMIKVVDTESDKVILEIPPKKLLDMVAYLCKEVGIIDKKA